MSSVHASVNVSARHTRYAIGRASGVLDVTLSYGACQLTDTMPGEPGETVVLRTGPYL